MISKIEIQYFRSIYRETISNIQELNIFSGKNDVGKSNVLKALNLFFNNCIVEDGDYSFKENYNLQRLNEVRKETIKGKQFIQIKLMFVRGKQYEKTLPEVFVVSKKWNRDSNIPQITDDIEARLKKAGRSYNARCRASLTRFLNSIKYIYIPAIKDQHIFDLILQQLQNTVYHNKLSENATLKESLAALFDSVVNSTKELSDEFEKKTKVKSMISTPSQVDELYRTLNIITQVEGGTVSLENRGDGIRVRYLPSILNYIASNSNEKYIWGFEEPENSLEFNLAIDMAGDFYNTYRIRNTIFLTTHSPAFIDLGYKEFCNGYRCYKMNQSTKIVDFKNADSLQSLNEELGYIKILRKQYEEYQKMKELTLVQNDVIEKLKTEILLSKKPVLLTEGKTDAKILAVAWEKLYEYDCPFDIKDCNLLDANVEKNALAGAGILKKILCSVRFDDSKTIIGLFDNDKAGQDAYKLDENYEESTIGRWKKHKNGKGYAMLIPAVGEVEKIADIKNLSVEFLFPKKSLDTQVAGKKLTLISPYEVRKINGIDVEKRMAGEEYWYYSKIDDTTKMDFAFCVVPCLEQESFSNFRPLFEQVMRILEEIT